MGPADGRLCIHLLNLCGAEHAPTYRYPELIPSIGPIRVKMRVPQEPATVNWVPDGEDIEWSWSDGVITATIPRLHIHGVLVVEQPYLREVVPRSDPS